MSTPPVVPVFDRERRRRQFLRAALAGALTGAVAVLFKLAVDRAHLIGRTLAVITARWGLAGPLLLAAITAAIGAAAAYVTGRVAPEAGGSGIPHVKGVLLGARSFRPLRVLLVKFGAGFGALAAGMSLGREGPTIQMGAAVGRLVGDVLRVRRRSYPTLIASGAGAGLAAAFNAPLAGFLFVMEEMQREMSALTYGTALVGSVCAVAVSRLIAGQGPSFALPVAALPALRTLPVIAIAGVVLGLAGVLFNRLLVGAIELRDRVQLPRWAAGAIAGGIAGLLLAWVPDITGPGHAAAEALLSGAVTYGTLAALGLFAGKLLLTVLCYASGVPGGIFAPLLLMGAFLGSALGTTAGTLLPGLGVPATVFATVGMAAILAGSVRAPLTGVVLIVEMTSEYDLLYALLVASFAAYLVAEGVRDMPIYERLLARDLHAHTVEEEAPEPFVIEVLVEPHSTLDGARVSELEHHPGAVIAAVRRGPRFIVPEGRTLLLAGDLLTIVADARARATVGAHFQDAARQRGATSGS